MTSMFLYVKNKRIDTILLQNITIANFTQGESSSIISVDNAGGVSDFTLQDIHISSGSADVSRCEWNFL
jgi:hypothetical protein